MSSDDAVLAPIYDRIGMAEFAATLTPRLITFAQQHDWAGRRILDLGCGTGGSGLWLVERGYNVTGVDHNPHMLAQFKSSLAKKNHTAALAQADIRQLPALERIDMILALNVINTLESLRDLEMVFKGASEMLANGRYFIFDTHTVEGLTNSAEVAHERIFDANDLTVFNDKVYDYDRQILTITYDVFQKEGTAWQRNKSRIVVRAYALQAIAALLKRYDFSLVALVDARMEPVNITIPRTMRAVFVTRKGAGE